LNRRPGSKEIPEIDSRIFGIVKMVQDDRAIRRFAYLIRSAQPLDDIAEYRVTGHNECHIRRHDCVIDGEPCEAAAYCPARHDYCRGNVDNGLAEGP